MQRKKVYRLIVLAAMLLAAFVLFGSEAQAGQKAVKHIIDLKLDIESRSIEAVDTIEFTESGDVRLLLRPDSKVLKIIIGNKEANFTVTETGEDRIKVIRFRTPEGETKASIHYTAQFPPIESEAAGIKRGVAYVEDGVIGKEGALLPSGSLWYPQEEEGLNLFEVKSDLPALYTSVTEGERVSAKRTGDRITEKWKTAKPIDGLDLIIAMFIWEHEEYKGVDIYTFFLNRDERLSKTYIEKTKYYLDLYGKMIGPYPFEKFAVVEGFLPTGYGMPSFTLLGSSVIRLPFIPDTSLGHEIAHNWWGNSVFVDLSHGNWVEAITTYTADYLYEKNKGEKEARDFRFNKLRGYKNYAEKSDIALKDFMDSVSLESRTVGYNKGLLVFNMLEDVLGSDVFEKGLKIFYGDFAFKKASWVDIRSSFEKASGQDLGWFFTQWLDRAGGPHLKLESAEAKKSAKGYEISLRVSQKKDDVYTMELPVLIKTDTGDERRTARLDKAEGEFAFTVKGRPTSVEIDPDYRNFRILADAETPPSFASLFGDKNAMIIVPSKEKAKYIEAAELLSKDYGLKVVTDADADESELAGRSAFIIGTENSFFKNIKELGGKVGLSPEGISIEGKRFNRGDTILAIAAKKQNSPDKVVCYLIAEADKKMVDETVKRLRYFTEWSYIAFPKDAKPEKGLFEGDKVLRKVLNVN